MATSLQTGTAVQIPVQHGHRRIVVVGLILLAGCAAAIVLVVALSNGGGSAPSAPARVTASRPSINNAGPTDGTPSAVSQALGSTPARGYSLSTNVYAPATTGAPISGVSPQVNHLPR